jgi:hypothetical protein
VRKVPAPVPVPPPPGLSADVVASGLPVHPEDRVKLFSAEQWERFVALMRLCIEDERPFPNFVLIDSPLLVYEEPDAGELLFPLDIKRHFWESVKTFFPEAQVIIIENSPQLPGVGTLDGVKVVLFTGNDQGRRGFIPQAGGAA